MSDYAEAFEVIVRASSHCSPQIRTLETVDVRRTSRRLSFELGSTNHHRDGLVRIAADRAPKTDNRGLCVRQSAFTNQPPR